MIKSSNFPSQNIFLCGMMGSGKTTTGRELAKKLSVPFHDIDSIIEKKTGKTIPEIFETGGEESFRKLEFDTLIEAMQSLSGVIALGGGSLQNQHLTDQIKRNGWLIFLNIPEDELVERLRQKSGRPLLINAPDLSVKISSLMNQRIPYYSQAHFSVQTSGLTAGEIAEEIINKLRFYEQRN